VDLRSHSGLHSACTLPARGLLGACPGGALGALVVVVVLLCASAASVRCLDVCSPACRMLRAQLGGARSCRGWDCEEPEGPEHRERKPPEHCQTATHGSGRGEPWLRGEVPWIEARDRGRNSPVSDTRRKELATVRRAMEEDKTRLLWVSWGRVRPWRR
jgi:hypothetical protein